MNGFWVNDEFVPGEGVHLGVAISLRQGGLIAPAIHNADTLALDELMDHLRDLVSRARAGRLKQSEMDPTITITNLGDQGVDSVYGVIYPPQVTLVGFGKPSAPSHPRRICRRSTPTSRYATRSTSTRSTSTRSTSSDCLNNCRT